MAQAATTSIDLARLSLAHGEGVRLEPVVERGPLEIAGQTYTPTGAAIPVCLDISRPTNGYAFRLRFPLRVEGPCMRCLEPAAEEADVDVREVDAEDTEDEELRSPYVEEQKLDLGRWVHDAAVLVLPARILCREDCAGICPVCGLPLNDADPAEHEHETVGDPRWAKLDELKRGL